MFYIFKSLSNSGQGPGARGQGPGARGQGPGARGQRPVHHYPLIKCLGAHAPKQPLKIDPTYVVVQLFDVRR
jgi:hypothetical protein